VDYDQLFVGGDLTLAGIVTFNFDGFTRPIYDTTYDLIHVAGSILGDWSSFNDIQFLNPFADFDLSLLGFSIVESSVTGYDKALRLTIAGIDGPAPVPVTNAVPEPASALLVGLGGMAILTRRRRHQ